MKTNSINDLNIAPVNQHSSHGTPRTRHISTVAHAHATHRYCVTLQYAMNTARRSMNLTHTAHRKAGRHAPITTAHRKAGRHGAPPRHVPVPCPPARSKTRCIRRQCLRVAPQRSYDASCNTPYHHQPPSSVSGLTLQHTLPTTFFRVRAQVARHPTNHLLPCQGSSCNTPHQPPSSVSGLKLQHTLPTPTTFFGITPQMIVFFFCFFFFFWGGGGGGGGGGVGWGGVGRLWRCGSG